LALRRPIIDTHAHAGDAHHAPPGEPFGTIEELLRLMDANDVRVTVLVPYLGFTDNAYLAEAVSRWPDRFVGVAYVNWRREDAVAELKRLAASRAFRGIRLEAHARSPGRDPFRIWKAADSLGLRVSVQGGRSPSFWSDGLGEVLRQIPGLNARIEHLARPHFDRDPGEVGFQGVLRLADYARLAINLDGLWAVSRCGPPYDDVWPYAEAAIAAFGPGRVMWGSDFPYLLECQRYSDSYGEIAERLAGQASATAAILCESACRFWDLPLPEGAEP
jgi:predicted TIM-barrel fold metal-dependent hydrolase